MNRIFAEEELHDLDAFHSSSDRTWLIFIALDVVDALQVFLPHISRKVSRHTDLSEALGQDVKSKPAYEFINGELHVFLFVRAIRTIILVLKGYLPFLHIFNPGRRDCGPVCVSTEVIDDVFDIRKLGLFLLCFLDERSIPFEIYVPEEVIALIAEIFEGVFAAVGRGSAIEKSFSFS